MNFNYFIMIVIIVLVCLLIFYRWKNRIGSKEPPVSRSYIEVISKTPMENYIEKIRVSSYNLLADSVSFRIINHCPYEFLNFNYRSVRIVEELEISHPDIFCLQEVDHFRRFYKKEFEKIGYSSIFNKRNKKCCRHGVVIGFLSDKYQLLEVSNIYFNDIDPNDNFYKTNSAAVIGLFKNRKTDTLFIVSSVHTWMQNKVVIYAQVAFLLHKINQFIKKNQSVHIKKLSMNETPIIIGGDFNAIPTSDPIRFMQNLPPIFPNNMKPEEKKRILHIWEQYQHGFKLKSAYENYKLHKEPNENNGNCEDLHPDYTLVKNFYFKHYKACLDYLWYNNEVMDVTRVLEIPDEKIIAKKGLKGLPNSLFSSDHLRIEAEFGIKEKK